MKKILISGLVAGFAMLFVGAMVGFIFPMVFPSLQAEYSNPALLRPFSDRTFLAIFLMQPFVAGILLSWIWSRVNGVIKAKTSFKKGLQFGLGYWLVITLGLMLAYASSPYSLLMVVSWGASLLLQALCAGLVYAKMNR